MDVINELYYFRGTTDSHIAARRIRKLIRMAGCTNKDGWYGVTPDLLYYAEADTCAISACKESTTLAQMLIRFGKNIGDE